MILANVRLESLAKYQERHENETALLSEWFMLTKCCLSRYGC